MAVSAVDFRSGMRQLAAAVNIVTTVHDGHRSGMTATAVVSLTAEPPQLAVAVNRSNASYAAFSASGIFAVNVLPHDHPDLAATFSGATGVKGEDRFATGSWERLETGAPILRDSVASFDCRIIQTVEFSSHVLFVGLVEAIRVIPATSPLLYIDGNWASLVRADDVEFAAYEQVVDKVAAAIDTVLATSSRPRDQLHQFSRAFVELNADAADVLRSFFSHESYANPARLDAINRRKREVEDKLRVLLTRGAELGEFEISDPVATADAIIGMLNSFYRSPNWSGSLSSEALGRHFGDLVIAMVTPRSS